MEEIVNPSDFEFWDVSFEIFSGNEIFVKKKQSCDDLPNDIENLY